MRIAERRISPNIFQFITDDVAEHPNGLVERAKTIVGSVSVLLEEVVLEQLGNLTQKGDVINTHYSNEPILAS